MPQRPRSHQLEDRSRHAFASLLPSPWVAERVVHDYGVDLRVEIFDERGLPTGQSFFVQLKATDRKSQGRGVTIRLRRDHLEYWNRLPEPTMVAVWLAASDTVYWRWSHLHHPWPRKREPKVESFRLGESDRWNPNDPASIQAEAAYCHAARADALRVPVEFQLEGHPTKPLPDEDLRAFTERWKITVDPRMVRLVSEPGEDLSHLVVGRGAVRVRIGRVILSYSSTDDGIAIVGETTEALVDDAVAVIGLMLGHQGNPTLGLELLRLHAKHSRLLARISTPGEGTSGRGLPMPQILLLRSGRFDIGLELAEQWYSEEGKDFQVGADALLSWLKLIDAQMDVSERARLDTLLKRRPSLSFLFKPDIRLSFADVFSEAGWVTRARDQYAAIADDHSESADISDKALERLVEADMASENYEDASKTLSQLIQRHPDDEQLRLRLGTCQMLDGNYTTASFFFASINGPEHHGEAWVRAATAALATQELNRQEQLRRPEQALEVARRLSRDAGGVMAVNLFHEAARHDAMSGETWRLYFMASLDRTVVLPHGIVGVLPVALLAWSDPEWWAMSLRILLDKGHVGAFLRGTECALTAVGPEFAELLGDEKWRLYDPGVARMVSGIAQAKRDGYALHVWEEPAEHEGKPMAVITRAPPDFRLFDVDLPPVDEWFQPLDTTGMESEKP